MFLHRYSDPSVPVILHVLGVSQALATVLDVQLWSLHRARTALWCF
jgi:hypothetical protein